MRTIYTLALYRRKTDGSQERYGTRKFYSTKKRVKQELESLEMIHEKVSESNALESWLKNKGDMFSFFAFFKPSDFHTKIFGDEVMVRIQREKIDE